MTKSSSPPEPPTITKKDRETFSARLRTALEAKGLSGRALEKRIGVATGVLTKICSGRLKLTRRLLLEIGQVLAIEPKSLVAGTGFAHILVAADPGPEADAAAASQDTLQRLQGDLAAQAAELGELRGEVAKLRPQLAAKQRELDYAVRLRDGLQSESARLRAGLKATQDSAAAIDDAATKTRRQLEVTVAQLSAKLKASEDLCRRWAGYARDRALRVKQLEKDKNHGFAGGAVIGGLLAAALGTSLAGKGRRR